MMIEERVLQLMNVLYFISVMPSPNAMVVSLLLYDKAPSPRVVTLLGTVKEVNAQLSKAPFPILVIPVPKLTDVREEQALKALAPMFSSLSGSVMEVKLEHQENAPAPRLITFSPILTDVRLLQ
jgi:hypothetical protein